jgi:hypothetical protein
MLTRKVVLVGLTIALIFITGCVPHSQPGPTATARPTETAAPTAKATPVPATATVIPALEPLPADNATPVPFAGYKSADFEQAGIVFNQWMEKWAAAGWLGSDLVGETLPLVPLEGGGVCAKVLSGSYFKDGVTTLLCIGVDKTTGKLRELPSGTVTSPDDQMIFLDLKPGEALKIVGGVYQAVDAQGPTRYVDKGQWVDGEYVQTPMEILQANLGSNYTLVPSADGGYQEVRSREGNSIPDVKIYPDGVVQLAYHFEGGIRDLWVAPQAIKAEGSKLTVGLWDYENGSWSQTMSLTAAEVAAGVEDGHKLVVVLGSEQEQQMIDTIFAARDMAMAKSGTYDPASEFENISVTVNFRTIDNFDPRPAQWQMVNLVLYQR